MFIENVGLLILDGFHNWGGCQLWADGENSAIDIVF